MVILHYLLCLVHVALVSPPFRPLLSPCVINIYLELWLAMGLDLEGKALHLNHFTL